MHTNLQVVITELLNQAGFSPLSGLFEGGICEMLKMDRLLLM